MNEAERRIATGATEQLATVINLRAEMNIVPGLNHRTPDMADTELDPAFGRSFPYRDGIISTVKFSGRSAWERHAADEIVIVRTGYGFLLMAEGDKIHPQSLAPDILVIVPAGRWHQIESSDGISFITITPQPTEHAPVFQPG